MYVHYLFINIRVNSINENGMEGRRKRDKRIQHDAVLFDVISIDTDV